MRTPAAPNSNIVLERQRRKRTEPIYIFWQGSLSHWKEREAGSKMHCCVVRKGNGHSSSCTDQLKYDRSKQWCEISSAANSGCRKPKGLSTAQSTAQGVLGGHGHIHGLRDVWMLGRRVSVQPYLNWSCHWEASSLRKEINECLYCFYLNLKQQEQQPNLQWGASLETNEIIPWKKIHLWHLNVS